MHVDNRTWCSRTAYVVLVLVVVAATVTCDVGNAQGFGRGRGRGQGPGAMPPIESVIESLPKQDLSAEERAGLELMREEEKLAHDVYVTLGEKWSLRPFLNIPRSEAIHMAAMRALLDRYAIADPSKGKKPGEFTNSKMQELYDKLIAQGHATELEAVKVGLTIEELDIADLERLMAETDNNDIRVVYQNLMKGSRNHLRAFSRQLDRLGGTYEPKHLKQAEFDRIRHSDQERGTLIADPKFKF